MILALLLLLLQQQQYYSSCDIVPHLRIYMPRRSAVAVVLTRVYVARHRHTLLSAACGSFDYRRLLVAPGILLLLRCERRAGLTRTSCSFKNPGARK